MTADHTATAKMTAQRLVDELVHAAKSVAFWEDHGRRGDGNLEQAKEVLKTKRRDLIREINRRALDVTA